MSIFSAPCGYLTVRGRIVTSRSLGAAAVIAAIASGLFRSMPTTAFVTPEAPHHDAQAVVDAPGLLGHQAVVGRQVRLALAAVEQNHLDALVLRRDELHVRRERGATEPHDARLLHGADDLLGREALPLRHAALARDLRRVRLDREADRGTRRPVGMRPPEDVGDGPGRRRVDGRRHEAVRRREDVATLDAIALLHDHLRGLARVLPHGEDQLRRVRHAPDRGPGRELLVLGRVDAVAEGRESRERGAEHQVTGTAPSARPTSAGPSPAD